MKPPSGAAKHNFLAFSRYFSLVETVAYNFGRPSRFLFYRARRVNDFEGSAWGRFSHNDPSGAAGRIFFLCRWESRDWSEAEIAQAKRRAYPDPRREWDNPTASHRPRKEWDEPLTTRPATTEKQPGTNHNRRPPPTHRGRFAYPPREASPKVWPEAKPSREAVARGLRATGGALAARGEGGEKRWKWTVDLSS